MASRVYKAGTIISRTKNLLDAGVLKTRPLWFDLIQALPPISLTHYNTPPIAGKPPTIDLPADRHFTNTEKNRSNSVHMGSPLSLFETHHEYLTTLAPQSTITQRKSTGDQEQLGNKKAEELETDSQGEELMAKAKEEELKGEELKVEEHEAGAKGEELKDDKQKGVLSTTTVSTPSSSRKKKIPSKKSHSSRVKVRKENATDRLLDFLNEVENVKK